MQQAAILEAFADPDRRAGQRHSSPCLALFTLAMPVTKALSRLTGLGPIKAS